MSRMRSKGTSRRVDPVAAADRVSRCVPAGRQVTTLLPQYGTVAADPLAAAAFSHTAIRANAGPQVQAEFAADRREVASNVPAAAPKLPL
jgi:hypothetical protein